MNPHPLLSEHLSVIPSDISTFLSLPFFWIYYVLSITGEILQLFTSSSMQSQHRSNSNVDPSYSVPYPHFVWIENSSCLSQKSISFPHLLQYTFLAIYITSNPYIKLLFYILIRHANMPEPAYNSEDKPTIRTEIMRSGQFSDNH